MIWDATVLSSSTAVAIAWRKKTVDSCSTSIYARWLKKPLFWAVGARCKHIFDETPSCSQQSARVVSSCFEVWTVESSKFFCINKYEWLGHIWAHSSFGPLTHLGPNTFGPQLIWAPTYLGPDSFGPQHIWAPTHLGPGSFGPRLIWAPTHLGPNSFGPWLIWAPTHLGPDSFLSLEKFFKFFKFNFKISKSRCFLSHRGIIDKKSSFYVIYIELVSNTNSRFIGTV